MADKYDRFQRSNGRSLSERLFYAYAAGWLSATSRYSFGTNVFEKDWDVLVVLDACRVDAMRAVAPEYSFIESVDSIWSVGSTSNEWYAKTFTREFSDTLSETALISANPFAEAVLADETYPPHFPTSLDFTKWDVLSADELARFEQTRDHDRPFSDIGDMAPKASTAQSPGYVTDRAIVANRRGYDSVMAHYFQPHRPFIHDLVTDGEELTYLKDEPHELIRANEATKEDVWPLYLDNLRLVLDSIEVLLENADAETVAITADHGELFGELGQSGHFVGVPHPQLKRVPWIETTAVDERTREPDEEFSTGVETSTREQLRDLGYL